MSRPPRRRRSARDDEIVRLERAAEKVDRAARATNTWRAYDFYPNSAYAEFHQP